MIPIAKGPTPAGSDKTSDLNCLYVSSDQISSDDIVKPAALTLGATALVAVGTFLPFLGFSDSSDPPAATLPMMGIAEDDVDLVAMPTTHAARNVNRNSNSKAESSMNLKAVSKSNNMTSVASASPRQHARSGSFSRPASPPRGIGLAETGRGDPHLPGGQVRSMACVETKPQNVTTCFFDSLKGVSREDDFERFGWGISTLLKCSITNGRKAVMTALDAVAKKGQVPNVAQYQQASTFVREGQVDWKALEKEYSSQVIKFLDDMKLDNSKFEDVVAYLKKPPPTCVQLQTLALFYNKKRLPLHASTISKELDYMEEEKGFFKSCARTSKRIVFGCAKATKSVLNFCNPFAWM